MKKTIIQMGAIIMSYFALSICVASPHYFYVFGDSLFDHGNLKRIKPDVLPKPYDPQRFSNGPITPDYLYATLHKKDPNLQYRNKAYAGSLLYRKSKLLHLKKSHSIFSIINESSNFSSNDIILVTGGGNDVFGHPFFLNLIYGWKKIFRALENKHAKNIIILGVPAIQFTPAYKHLNFITRLFTWYIVYKITQTNKKLNIMAMAYEKKHPGSHVALVNPEKLMDILWKNAPPNYHLTKGCIDSYGFKPPTRICSDPQNYVFWDNIHPTTQIDKLLANALYAAWTNQSVTIWGKHFSANQLRMSD